MSINMLAPFPGALIQTPAGIYTADANGMIYGVTGGLAIASLSDAGCIPLPFSPSAFPRDLLDGGDFTTNPFQRNIPGLATSNVIATAITNTPTYFADRWFHWGASTSSIKPAMYVDTSYAGYSQALKVNRTAASTDTNAINTAQILETADSVRCQGQYLTFSIIAKCGANFSATTNNLTMSIIGSAGTNQSAASLAAGTWSVQTTLATQVVNLQPGYQKFTLTTTNPVPTTMTQLAVQLSFTPVGTAGTDDSFYLLETQLEMGTISSPFERQDIQVVLEICQRYAWVIPEPANGVLIGAGTTLGSNVQNFYMATPVQMLKAPTVTVSAGSFKVAVGAAYAAATSLAAGATHTVNAISLTAANTATAGVGALLGGGGGSGYIVASADF